MTVRMNEAGRTTLKIVIRRAGKPAKTLGSWTRTVRFTRASAKEVRVAFGKKLRAALGRQRRLPTISVAVTATDAAGNRLKRTARPKLRR
jgi:hypothetical protein